MVDFTLLPKQVTFFLLGIFSLSQSLAQSEVHRTEPWIPNSSLNRVEHSNGYTMLSGYFSSVEEYTGSGVVTDVATGLVVDGQMPKVNGSVYVSISDGSGGYYIGGDFTYVDTVKIRNLAHIKPDKTVDRTWKPDPDNSPSVLFINGTTLYIGGYFSEIAGQTRNSIAAFDTTTGALTSWNPDANGGVQSIQVAGTTVYLGGYFTTVSGLSRPYLAAVSATTGLPTTWTVSASSSVLALAIDTSTNTIFVAGTFNSVGASSRLGVARLSLAGTGSVTAWTANINTFGYVQDLILSGTSLYMAGGFNTVNGVTREGVAAVNASTGALLAWNPALSPGAFIYDLDIAGTTVYLVGYFDSVNLTARDGVAAVDATTAAVLPWAPDTNSTPTTVTASSTGVFIGGYFNGMNGLPRDGFALLDNTTDKPWPFSFSLNGGTVNTIAVKDNVLYIGGQFTAIDKTARRNLAAFDLTTGTLLAWNPSVFGVSSTDPDAYVSSMLIKDNNLYIAGKFFAVNTAATIRPGLASIDVSTGIVSNWNPMVGDGKTTNQYVNSIDISGNTLYAAGSFSLLSGSQSRANLAAIDLTSGAILPWNPTSNSEVTRIRVTSTTAYVVGDFANGIGVPSVIRDFKIAAVNLGSNSLTSWNPEFTNGSVYDIAIGGSDLYVGGDFNAVATSFKPGLASFALATGALNDWTPDVGDNSDGGFYNYSLSTSANRLFIAGAFSFMGNETRNYYGEYNTCPSKPVIAIDGYTLSTSSSGNLQWYENGVLVPGATSQSYQVNPLEYGVYSVTVSAGGCAISSDDFAFLITAAETTGGRELTLYPNPASSELSVHLNGSKGSADFTFIDMMGRTLKQIRSNGPSHQLSVQDLDSGPYLLMIKTGDQQYVRKFLKVK